MEKEKIGANADTIWQILNKERNVKISDLKKITKMEIKDIYLALGWLAKETKIHFFEKEKEFAVGILSQSNM
jgi:hypothetical protein